MPEFEYRAANREGAVEQGTVQASSEQLALVQLRSRGLTPVRIVAANGGGSVETLSLSPPPANTRAPLFSFLQKDSVTPDDIFRLTAELAVLLKAGLPIDRALKVQVDMSVSDTHRDLLQYLLDTLKSGKPLSVGLEGRVELFGNFYINMVRSGEASGDLGAVLAQLGDYLKSSREARATVVSALIYPAILAVVSVLSIAVMLGFVVPQFEALFEDMGEGLPALTRGVIAVGDFIQGYGWLLVLLLALAVYLARRWFATEEGKTWKDGVMLGLPLVGPIVFKFEVARFSRTMGTLLGSGVSMLQSLSIAISTVDNSLVRAALASLAPAVKSGRRMSEVLAESESFTPMVIQMVRVGEESGRLDSMMMELAQVYESDVEAGVKRGLTLLEPVLILAMGLGIALIIISILMGILSVNDLAI